MLMMHGSVTYVVKDIQVSDTRRVSIISPVIGAIVRK